MASKLKSTVAVAEDISDNELSGSDAESFLEDPLSDVELENMECESVASEKSNCDDSRAKKNPPQNLGWANVMSKVLHSKVNNQKNFILSKAKKDSEVKLKPAAIKKIELVDESGNVIKEEEPPEKVMSSKMKRKILLKKRSDKHAWENMCRKKPDITCKEKERELVKIATRGVVHLFNTVEKYQKSLLTSQDKKEPKAKLTKGKFIDILKGSSKRESKVEADSTQKSKETWNILRDDYMMGADMKDWDKQSNDDDDEKK